MSHPVTAPQSASWLVPAKADPAGPTRTPLGDVLAAAADARLPPAARGVAGAVVRAVLAAAGALSADPAEPALWIAAAAAAGPAGAACMEAACVRCGRGAARWAAAARTAPEEAEGGGGGSDGLHGRGGGGAPSPLLACVLLTVPANRADEEARFRAVVYRNRAS
jgi:hypothetical protein